MENEEKNREVLALSFSYDSIEDLKIMSQDPELMDTLHEDIIEVSKEIIKKDLPKIHLYNINEFNLKVEIKRDQLKHSLEYIKKRYESQQKFEKCAEIQSLIKEL